VAEETKLEDDPGEDSARRAVRAIRAYLPELVRYDRAAAMDEQLRAWLREPDGTDAAVELLEAEPATHAWLAGFFETGLPPDLAPMATRGNYKPLPGHRSPTAPQRYTCPIDRIYDWYRVEIAEEVPECRDHPGIRLVPA
jgi:hypothetical protein